MGREWSWCNESDDKLNNIQTKQMYVAAMKDTIYQGQQEKNEVVVLKLVVHILVMNFSLVKFGFYNRNII